jgi:hypothetical protein
MSELEELVEVSEWQIAKVGRADWCCCWILVLDADEERIGLVWE